MSKLVLKPSYKYFWPEEEAFVSGYACRFLPRRGLEKVRNAFIGPVYNLLDFSKTLVLAFSWTLVFVIWYVLYFIMPIGVWNSEDRQYLEPRRVIISTIIIYFVVSFFLIGSLMKSGCKALEDQAASFLFDEAPPLPPTLVE